MLLVVGGCWTTGDDGSVRWLLLVGGCKTIGGDGSV